jgi:hypothetical protein
LIPSQDDCCPQASQDVLFLLSERRYGLLRHLRLPCFGSRPGATCRA